MGCITVSVMTSASAARRLFAARQKFKRANTLWSKGFTLIEVVIVAAIAGVLGAVAIPQFLGTRDRAQARAQTAEAVGLAKECATFFTEGVPAPVASPGDGIGETVSCGDTTVGVTINSGTFPAATATLNCAATLLATGTTQASIDVSITGAIDCNAG